jgi:uncharacterized protein (DUF736 family)
MSTTTKQSDGAAWKKTVNTKNGAVEILSITIGDKRYTAWPNAFKKEGERSPDYRLQADTYRPKAETKETFAGEDLPF